MNRSQLINQTSGKVEYGTPQFLVEAARETMGTIDLDPASIAHWNKRIEAAMFFSDEINALTMPWHGNVWLNHPFGAPESACPPRGCKKIICRKRGYHIDQDRPGNGDWINYLLREFTLGHTKQACCITFASTSENWFRPLLDYTQCFLFPRTNYVGLDGRPISGVTKGSVVTYLGPNPDKFHSAFGPHGAIKELRIPF